ncbi:acyltransferase [Streptomyces sp. NBC_00086]|nr:acyltransferase [Streptomyces sp. NBC_00086]
MSSTRGMRGIRRPAEGRARPRLYILDGLRLVAALMVVLYHYTVLWGGWGHDPRTIFPTLHDISQYGWLGVEVFFLISGFVICMSTWGRHLGDFAVSRISRLFPAYWAAIILTTLVVNHWPEVRGDRTLDEVLTNLTMLQKGLGVRHVDDVYWTLFIELKFYLLFALVVAGGVTYRKCVLFCALWTVAGVASVAAAGNKVPASAFGQLLDMWAMPLYSPYFVAGIAFYLMHRFKPTAALWGIVGVSFLLAQHSLVLRLPDAVSGDSGPPAWPGRLIIGVAFVLMALIALGAFNWMQWRWLTTAGALTYPLYLVHENIGFVIIHEFRGRIPALVLVALTAVAMMLLAYAIHRVVERPLGKVLAKKLRGAVEELRLNTPLPGRRPVPPAAVVRPEPQPQPQHEPKLMPEQERV